MLSKNPVILMVDDDERNLRLLAAMLASQEYTLVTASNGEEALERVQESPPDVILLDVMMPVLDGFETARKLKESEETRIIPVVMVTSLNEITDRVKALDAGVDDFLSKPVDSLELKIRVKTLLKVKEFNDYMRNYQRLLEKEVLSRTQELQEAVDKLKFASLETIHRLSRAAEYRDDETGSHIIRMGGYAAAIASKMGLEKSFANSLLYVAPMHDVGKIGIPDNILLKPSKLTNAEWKIMKQHTLIGANILKDSDSEIIKTAQIVALTHHEGWDGTGYPTGLFKEEIPLVGRIAAVADVFDALTSKRPYRNQLSYEIALSIIRKERGGKLDPQVVDAFFAAQSEIVSIGQVYNLKNVGED